MRTSNQVGDRRQQRLHRGDAREHLRQVVVPDGHAVAGDPLVDVAPGGGSCRCRPESRWPSAASASIAVVEPLPLVPVTWITGIASCGSPSTWMSRRMGSRRDPRAHPRRCRPSPTRGRGGRRASSKGSTKGDSGVSSRRGVAGWSPTWPSWDQRGVHVVDDDVRVDDHLRHVIARRQFVHDPEEHLFEDGPQATCAGPAHDGLVGHRLEGVGGELEFDVLELEDLSYWLAPGRSWAPRGSAPASRGRGSPPPRARAGDPRTQGSGRTSAGPRAARR